MGRSKQEAAAYVLAKFEEFGVNVPPSSRFGRMHAVLSRGKVISSQDKDFQIARESVRDIHTLEFVFEHLAPICKSVELKKCLKHCVKDSVLPQIDRTNSPGRDFQFQLFVAAICAKAGLYPELLEPDIIVNLNGAKRAIAVKRIKSEEGLIKRFKYALKQIDNSVPVGFVVMDISPLANPQNEDLPNVCDAELSRAHRKRCQFIGTMLRPQMMEWISERQIMGLFIIDHYLQFDGSEWGVRSFTDAISFERGVSSEFDCFKREFDSGFPIPSTLI